MIFLIKARPLSLILLLLTIFGSSLASKEKDFDSETIIYCIGNHNSTGSCFQETQFLTEKTDTIDCLITSWPFVKCKSQQFSETSNYDCFALTNTSIHNQISLSCTLSVANDEFKSNDETKNIELIDSSEEVDNISTNNIDEEPLIMQSPFNQSLNDQEFQKQGPQNFNEAFN